MVDLLASPDYRHELLHRANVPKIPPRERTNEIRPSFVILLTHFARSPRLTIRARLAVFAPRPWPGSRISVPLFARTEDFPRDVGARFRESALLSSTLSLFLSPSFVSRPSWTRVLQNVTQSADRVSGGHVFLSAAYSPVNPFIRPLSVRRRKLSVQPKFEFSN